jgi:hypothetical protein
MKRNVNATCGTCPYWDRNIEGLIGLHSPGYCRINNTPMLTLQGHWCGQHPEFWLPDENKKTYQEDEE